MKRFTRRSLFPAAHRRTVPAACRLLGQRPAGGGKRRSERPPGTGRLRYSRRCGSHHFLCPSYPDRGKRWTPLTAATASSSFCPLLYEGCSNWTRLFEPQPFCAKAILIPRISWFGLSGTQASPFSDGSALSAADVAAALQRAKHPHATAHGCLPYPRSVSKTALWKLRSARPTTVSPPCWIFRSLKSSAGSAVPIGTGPYVYTTGTMAHP